MNTFVLQFPTGGMVDETPRSEQPPLTTRDSLNVLPRDRFEIGRGAQRPGMAYHAVMGAAVTALCGVNTAAGTRKLYSIAGGNVFRDLFDLGAAGGADIVAGGGRVFSGLKVEDSNAMVDLSSLVTAGTAPLSAVCTTIWRQRLVYGGIDNVPHAWAMSRSGDFFDFDYGATDPARAIAGQNADSTFSGGIADPITALIPWTDDSLIVGHDHSISIIRGDPAAGGSIDMLNQTVGIVSSRAWCLDPLGGLWILATGGLFRCDGVQVQPVSAGRYNAWFESIDLYAAQLVWDEHLNGLWIWAGQQGVFFSAKTGTFWPMASELTIKSAVAYAGKVHLGNNEGYILKFQDNTPNDYYYTAGAPAPKAINSHIWFGPYRLAGPARRTKLLRLQAVLGEVPEGYTEADNWRADWTLNTAHTAELAIKSPDQTLSGTFSKAGANPEVAVRLCGEWFAFKLSNSAMDKFWSFDQADIAWTEGGRR